MKKFMSIFKEFPDDFVFSDYDWEYREQIGQGAFGKIFKVKNKNMNTFDAIKQIDMQYFDQQFKIQALKTEIQIMQKIDSPNVVQIKDSYIGKKFTYIILELCDSDLRKQLTKNKGNLSQVKCCQIFNQLAQAFQEIHKKGYIHRDIKPQNILIKNNVYKVADFGFTRKIKDKQTIEQVCGTPLYMAPQLIFNQKYTGKCDIWSLGLMLYEMIFGFNPWPTKHPDVYKSSIRTKPIAFPYDTRIGRNTFDFLKKCLQVDENKRISWEQFFNHHFIKQKDTGNRVSLPMVSQRNQRVLKSIQQNILQRNIDVLAMFKYSKRILTKNLKKDDFFAFLSELDPTITTFESEQLFTLTDCNKNGSISIQQFNEIFCQIDYRPCDDIVSRRIQQIIVIAQARNIKMHDLFKIFDKNNSNTIDKKQFEEMIRRIEPKISSLQIEQLWTRFDSNNSGFIQKDEFFAEMTRNGTMEATQSLTRAKRNIYCLTLYLECQKMSLKTFFRNADKDNDQKLSIQEFGTKIQQINYKISKEEIVEMFRLVDSDRSNSLELNQMESSIRESRVFCQNHQNRPIG